MVEGENKSFNAQFICSYIPVKWMSISVQNYKIIKCFQAYPLKTLPT